MNGNVRRITTIGMLCALAYTAAAVGRVPLVLFLRYDPKDSVIAISGFLFGPLAACSVAGIVSLIELATLSDTGVLGLLMNILSSCTFACTAALVYRKRPAFSGAAAGLLCGWGCMVSVMMVWNYLVAPLYMGVPREEVAKLLLPAFLPFNLLKGGLNAAITMLLYRPVQSVLGRSAKH